MDRWFVTIEVHDVLPESIKQVVADARDVAISLGVDRLGIANITDGEETYYIMRKGDFEEWFGE